MGLPTMPEAVCAAIRDALPWEWDDPRYGENALVPGRPPIEFSFVEAEEEVLRLDFEPCGPGTSPAARRRRALDIVTQWVSGWGVPAVVREFGRALEPLRTHPLGPEARFGAFLGATCGREGLAEAKIYWELAGELPQACSARLEEVAALVAACLPGVTPHFASLAYSRTRCVPRLYFLCREETRLIDLRPVLAAVGLEHRLPELVTLAGGFVGRALMLPAGAGVLSFREAESGIDCKLELLTRALTIRPETLIERVWLIASERGGTRTAICRWLSAFGVDGLRPGLVNVIGFRVSATRPARLGLYFTPERWGDGCLG
jgi:hypothetical protein